MGKKKAKGKSKKGAKKTGAASNELDEAAIRAKRAAMEIVTLKSQAARSKELVRRASDRAFETKVRNTALVESLDNTKIDLTQVSTTVTNQYKALERRCRELEAELHNTKKLLELSQLESQRKTTIIDRLQSRS
eukprot:m.112614 g.112614  ORF g.112614 m.112614 type:complete len:134 (-) comp28202_c2_seq1:50-451(-)